MKKFYANNLKVKDLDIALATDPALPDSELVLLLQRFSYAAEKPIITIDTIEALATDLFKTAPNTNFKDPVLYCPMIDARRMEYITFTIKTQNHQNTKPFIIDENNLDSYLAQYSIILVNWSSKCYDLYKHKGNIYLNEQIKCSAKYLIPLALHKYEAEDLPI